MRKTAIFTALLLLGGLVSAPAARCASSCPSAFAAMSAGACQCGCCGASKVRNGCARNGALSAAKTAVFLHDEAAPAVASVALTVLVAADPLSTPAVHASKDVHASRPVGRSPPVLA